MARPLRIQYPGAYYHIMCRGNARRNIFVDDGDRHHFLTLLGESMRIYKVVLYAYAMMSSHFHLVVQTKRGNLSEFMRRFNICYTGWFHYRYGTCGHLYQGRYKSCLVDADSYLLELSRYVHLNPIGGSKFKDANFHDRFAYLQKYLWSSLHGYLDKQKVNELVSYDLILGTIGGRASYRRFITAGISDGIGDLFQDVRHQTILGDDDFVAYVKTEYLEKGSSRDQPAYRGMQTEYLPPDEILSCVSRACGVSRENMVKRGGGGTHRGLLAEFLHRYCGMTEASIGRYVGGIDYGGVHQLRRRLKLRMNADKQLRDKFQDIDEMISELCSK
ncbi:MAG: transposase [candidate division WOR-3 bacterium]|nr:MAG: transposase [candidate division WOR-3 bacterium]